VTLTIRSEQLRHHAAQLVVFILPISVEVSDVDRIRDAGSNEVRILRGSGFSKGAKLQTHRVLPAVIFTTPS
jgi:hypothetical protein